MRGAGLQNPTGTGARVCTCTVHDHMCDLWQFGPKGTHARWENTCTNKYGAHRQAQTHAAAPVPASLRLNEGLGEGQSTIEEWLAVL